MKKSDIKDMTIRASTDNTQAGADAPSGMDVAAPKTMGQPSAAPSNPDPSEEMPVGHARPDSAESQPACAKPPSVNSVEASPVGQAIGFPPAADMSSPGPITTAQGMQATQVTGAKVPFPPAADTSMQPKVVTSWKP
jgi:hypothetical protein